MNQVKESRISKVLEGIKMAFTALSVNDALIGENLDSQVEEIKKAETPKLIENKEKSVDLDKIKIPLKNGFVPEAHVSEQEAREHAAEVSKTRVKTSKQKQRDE